MAHNCEPSKSRKTFVLRCDRPRYDGGVEIDLERYFGRRLQPNLNPLKKAEQQLKQVDQLREEARRILEEHTNPQAAATVAAEEAPESPVIATTAETVRPNSVAVPSESLWSAFCAGPQEIALGLLGVLVSLPTLVWAYGSHCPVLGDPALQVMRYCVSRIKHGIQTLLATPSRLVGCLPA